MEIMPAQASHLAAAAELWHRRASLRQQSDAFCQLAREPKAAWRSRALGWLHDPESALFVAVDGPGMIGYLAVAVAEGWPGENPRRIGRLLDVAVDLHQPHRGLSAGLLSRACDWLRGKNAGALTIDVPAREAVEQAFWLAQGAAPRFNQHWLRL